ncbi:universal stress protein [Nocardioides sp. LS1]|uniref:universal stress protein n=1 Tax=Nocardioides sp. LS1 TaxID=1027620 RepID=UPI000FF9559C|nr:universal stress protein [Nocardioides sp. LS1]GCD89083.1 universal stress protein [Nocardioides sp. LS1]
MTGIEVRPGSIVVGVDGSTSSTRAVAWAAEQASLEHRPLTLLHTIGAAATTWAGEPGVDRGAVLEALVTDGHALLATARAAVLDHAPGVDVHECVVLGDPRGALLEAASDAALLVVGSRGRGPVASLLLGSVGVALTRHPTCPVVVVRPGNPGLERHGVLVGIDGTQHSAGTLEFAYRQASTHGLPLTVMHCPAVDLAASAATDAERNARLHEARLLLARTVKDMAEKFPDVPVHTELCRGRPDECLVREGSRMHLVVIGAHHGGAVSGVLFGTITAAVVEHASSPVAVVPAPV